MENNQVIRPILNQQILQLPFYITMVGLNYQEKYAINRVNGYEDYQISVCLKGKGVFECGDKKYEINEHDIFWFAPNVPHTYYSVSPDPWILDWVIYNGQNVDVLFQDGFGIVRQDGASKIASGIERIYTLLCGNSMQNHMEASKELYILMLDLLAYRDGLYHKESSMQKFGPVVEYMEKYFSEEITLEELAEKADVSISYFCRKFKSVYFMSPLQYLIQLRINHAKKLILQFPQMSIKEIALHCGYRDVSYFTAEFKRNTGVVPTVYRNHKL